MTEYILFVDDEKLIKRLVSHYFRSQTSQGEYEFIFAHNGIEALERLQEQPLINLVVTDINMPEMDGLTLISKIRECRPDIKTIIVSAYEDLKILRQAMNLGVFDFINKPIDFYDLETSIKRTLEDFHKLKLAKLESIKHDTDDCINQMISNSINEINHNSNRSNDDLQVAQLVIQEVINHLKKHQNNFTEITLNYVNNSQEFSKEALLGEVSKTLESMKAGTERLEHINHKFMCVGNSQ